MPIVYCFLILIFSFFKDQPSFCTALLILVSN